MECSAAVILASASPRRRELLERIGVAVEVRPAAIDESPMPEEAPVAYACRIAAAKAAAVAADLPDRWLLAADTVVEVQGDILGKAADAAEATAMLERLVGQVHRVTTAFVLRRGDVRRAEDVTTEVVMRPAAAAELADYVASGEWRGKAGAYAVQGMAAALVTEVRGSITNVIGLPLAEVVGALGETGAAAPRYRQGVPA